MNAEKVLRELRKLLLNKREIHVENLTTNTGLTLEQVRQDQASINAFDWVVLNLDALAKSEEEDDDDK